MIQVDEFGPNTQGRDFVVGDLHGCIDEFILALNDIAFDKQTDRMFSVGDLIDRGPDSVACLELLYEPWFHAVLGNHERMMLDSLGRSDVLPVAKRQWWNVWMNNGGRWIELVDGEPFVEGWLDLLEALPIAITVERRDGEKIGICHAEHYTHDWDLVKYQSEEPLLWGRSAIRAGLPLQTKHIYATVHGHTPLKEPVQLGNSYYIDTGCNWSGKLTVLDLNDINTNELQFKGIL